MNAIRFDVFGRRILVVQTERGWSVYYAGADGKRRRAEDIIIPASVDEAGLERYLADLCHEWASEKHLEVRRLN